MLLVLMIASAIAEVVSLGAILPFIAALTAPDQLLEYRIVAAYAQMAGIVEGRELVLPLTIAFAAAALLAAATRILQLWANTRLAYGIGADLGIEVYRRTLHQPYKVHISRNSSEVVSGVTRKVDGVVVGVLMPMLNITSSVILLSSIMAALFVISWQASLIAITIFGAFYALMATITRRRLAHNGRRIATDQVLVYKALQEGLAGIRDVLLSGTQSYYGQVFRSADVSLRHAQGNNLFLALSPRYAVEALGMVLLAILAAFLVYRDGGAVATLPVLAALALGGQRMLPALQQGYAAWSNILGAQALLRDTVDLLDQPLPNEATAPAPEPLSFKHEIRFEHVAFTYPASSASVLTDFDLTIPKGSRVGLIGHTGSGKSTAIDILMALLPPDGGAVLVDGTRICSRNSRAWQRNIAHVPQNIYIADASFAENVALGESLDAIDMDRVRDAALRAQIATFIESQPDKYLQNVGENGVRLSGGQRQRIGLARALYRKASLLVLDEATSALDSATEESVMESVNSLDDELTIVMVAHRISTLKGCSLIVEVEGGKVKRKGGFAEITGNAA